MIYVEPFEDETGQPRFRLRSSNGQILASSEAYEGGAGHRDEIMAEIALGPIVLRHEDEVDQDGEPIADDEPGGE